MERDIYRILEVLNEKGFQEIDRQFFDTQTSNEHEKTRREFIEEMTIEFWKEYFNK